MRSLKPAVDQPAAPAPVRPAPDYIPAPPKGRSSRHRLNGLDGFRAVAVAVVVLFHFGVPGFSGGWVGPELFFVLSGYLITTLLLDRSDPDQGGLSLPDFWVRRIRRLYPALLLLVCSLVAVVALLDAVGASSVATVSPSSLVSEALGALAYYANWHLISEHIGYFGQSTSLFKHTWSLAIEEQFYVVWPLVFVLIRRARRWWRAVGVLVAGGGALASAVGAAVVANHSSINFVYYATQTNAFHLLTGVTLAFASHGWAPGAHTKRRLGYLAPPAIALIVVVLETASDASGAPRLWMLQGGELGLDLAAVALLTSLVFGDPGTAVSRVLNLRPVVWIGSVSYGIYLWHYPLGVLITSTGTGLTHLELVPVLIAATLAAAALSWSLVEVVVRETLISPTRLRWAVYGGGLAVAAALVGSAHWLIRPY